MESLFLPVEFRMFLAASGGKSDLNQQRLEVSVRLIDASSFLLACSFRILWCKAGPGAQVLGGFKDGYICSDFANDAIGSKGI